LENFFPELNLQARLSILAGVYSLILLLAGAICLKQVPERSWGSLSISGAGFFRNGFDVLRNKPFFVLLIAYTISALGGALPATLILFYVEHVLGSTQGSLFLVIYFLVGLLFLPLWVKLAARFEKKSVWLVSMLINTGAFAGVYFLGQGDLIQYGVLVGLSAVGYGATLAIPSSMQADVIDYDELRHGFRREGQHVGFWSISKKLSAALGAAIAFRVLDITGYVPSGEQNEETLFALRFLYAGLPCICNAVAMFVALFYPLSRAMHADIRQQIDMRGSAL
jgi:GPH family glycoside/pentoside/hexuronide:cation symporter